MKNILILFFLFFVQGNVFSQKTEFSKNKEHALYEKNKLDVQIVQSTYETVSGQVITESLKNLIIDLMTAKTGFVSVDFISQTKVIVEYQETIDQSTVLKNISRQGIQFVLMPNNVILNER